ncbi:kinase-like domain-containing protein [Hypomontagnella submonticulosa]|nr:kinase-like domain-containing protein [Hypomontagnella submonticulosa]
MNVLKSIEPHPSIPRCYSLVVDDKDHIIGMTAQFIPGGDLASNKHRTFKFKWLQQLTEILDYLHLDQGIVHGEIETDNMLIDESADRLVLIDFGISSWATESRVRE